MMGVRPCFPPRGCGLHIGAVEMSSLAWGVGEVRPGSNCTFHTQSIGHSCARKVVLLQVGWTGLHRQEAMSFSGGTDQALQTRGLCPAPGRMGGAVSKPVLNPRAPFVWFGSSHLRHLWKACLRQHMAEGCVLRVHKRWFPSGGGLVSLLCTFDL